MRRFVSIVRRLVHGRDAPTSSYALARSLFVRLLGAVFLIAIVSMWVQIDGLIGRSGILPAEDYLSALRSRYGTSVIWLAPSLCWVHAGPITLHGLCAVAAIASILLLLGFMPGPTLLLLWTIYLSLCMVGQVFLSFQWDALLLETAFVAMFFAPWGSRLSQPTPPGRAGLWLVWFLLFKLMFLSGVTKLLSGDPTWADLSALNVHYETQPLPTWVGWYAHQFCDGWQRFSVTIMFVIEIVVPLLIVAPRRLRHAGGIVLVLFQAAIAVTGNYGYFNLLTIVLCIPVFDDHLLRRFVPARWHGDLNSPPPSTSRPVRKTVIAMAVGVVAFVSFLSLLDEMVGTMRRWQQAVAHGAERAPIAVPVVTALDLSDRFLLSWANPAICEPVGRFRTINGYGLFRSMTTTRPELVIEGSNDRRTWREYSFRWKPGDLKGRPGFVAPHMPRLDWQMWFAALNPQGAGWLIPLMDRLLEGSPKILRLLANNPFPDHPPRYIRLVLYEYRFTDRATRRMTGAWWQRKLVGRFESRSAPQPDR